MSIKTELSVWDGKTVKTIERIYDKYKNKDIFVSSITELLQQEAFQKGASWLLKKHLEAGASIKQKYVNRIFHRLNEMTHWETKLHILQSLKYMPVEEAEKKAVEFFLRDCLASTNKFVRAWAYNGFYLLSSQYPEYSEETWQFFEMAMKDEAPSVKARVRKLIDKKF